MSFIKRTIVIGGRKVPAIQIGEAVKTTVELPNGRSIPALIAELMSLRTTNPVGPDGKPQEVTEYLTVTPENLRFCPLRFDTVVGLDVDEHGATLGLDVLNARMADNIADRQIARQAAQAAPVLSVTDLLAADAEPA